MKRILKIAAAIVGALAIPSSALAEPVEHTQVDVDTDYSGTCVYEGDGRFTLYSDGADNPLVRVTGSAYDSENGTHMATTPIDTLGRPFQMSANGVIVRDADIASVFKNVAEELGVTTFLVTASPIDGECLIKLGGNTLMYRMIRQDGGLYPR